MCRIEGIYFYCMLIDSINDYKNHKNIYSRNSNVCLEVCEMVFISSITFKNHCHYEKGYIIFKITGVMWNFGVYY